MDRMGQKSPTSKRFWNFTINTATESVDLRLDGNIVDDNSAWIYEWFGEKCAAPNAFRNELAQHRGKNITLWIDSYGGSVFAATGIYNALMEHKNTGAKITSVVDGKAMSAAVMPFLAGDERLISLAGMLMIHNPLTMYTGGYASDLRKEADILDEVKECVINAYELATGIDREEISQMMDNETYMSAKTAVDRGFATGVKYIPEASEKPENIMNFNFNRLAIQNAASDSMKMFFELARKNHVEETKEEPLMPTEIKNLEDLKKAYPELCNQLEITARNDGAQSERTRIQNIEKIANIIDPVLLNKAKFVEPVDAEKLAYQNAVLQSDKGSRYLKDAQEDSQNSGANNVHSTPNDGGQDGDGEKAKSEKRVNLLVDAANTIRR